MYMLYMWCAASILGVLPPKSQKAFQAETVLADDIMNGKEIVKFDSVYTHREGQPPLSWLPPGSNTGKWPVLNILKVMNKSHPHPLSLSLSLSLSPSPSLSPLSTPSLCPSLSSSLSLYLPPYSPYSLSLLPSLSTSLSHSLTLSGSSMT